MHPHGRVSGECETLECCLFFYFRSWASFHIFFCHAAIVLPVGAALKERSWLESACCDWVGIACLSLSAAVVFAILNAVCVTDVRLCTWEMQTLVRRWDLHNERTRNSCRSFFEGAVMGLLACFLAVAATCARKAIREARYRKECRKLLKRTQFYAAAFHRASPAG